MGQRWNGLGRKTAIRDFLLISRLYRWSITMLEKCTACGSRILAGATSFRQWHFCSDTCEQSFKVQLADQMLPPELVAEHVDALFRGPCPQCQKTTGNDLFSSTKVTGLLLLYHMESGSTLCCASCGRKNRLWAALHCLFLGWWSPRSAFINLFVLPTNIIAGLCARQPQAPSPEITQMVKCSLIEMMWPEIAKAIEAAEREALSASHDAETV
jgi:hypothetical protein